MKFLKIYLLGAEKFCGKIIFPSAPVCCIFNDRSLSSEITQIMDNLTNKMLYRAFSRQANWPVLNIPDSQGLLRVNRKAEKDA